MSYNRHNFRELVGQAIGRASICWDELPSGVFDSTTAEELVKQICDAADQLVKDTPTESTSTLPNPTQLPDSQESMQALSQMNEANFQTIVQGSTIKSKGDE
jgi:hypothetical protein